MGWQVPVYRMCIHPISSDGDGGCPIPNGGDRVYPVSGSIDISPSRQGV